MSLHLKMDGWNTSFLFGKWPMFKGEMLDSGSVVDVGFVLLYLELMDYLEYTQPIPIWIYVLFLYRPQEKRCSTEGFSIRNPMIFHRVPWIQVASSLGMSWSLG